MKNIQKIAPILLVILLFGCSPVLKAVGQTPTTEPTPFPTVVNEDKNIEPLNVLPDSLPKGIIIEFWHPWSGEIANLVDELVLEYNFENDWGTTIIATAHADERILIQDLQAPENSNDLPDVIAAPSYYLQMAKGAEQGLVNLNALLDSETWGFDAGNKPNFLPLFFDIDVSEGDRIGIPAYRTGHFIFWNKSWAEELGYPEVPTTSQQFQIEVCRAANEYLSDADLENDGLGGMIFSYDAKAMLSWFRTNLNKESRDPLRGSFLTDESLRALEYLYDLYFEDCAWTGQQVMPYQYFSNRQGIAYSGSVEDILVQERINDLNESSDDWTILPYPRAGEKPIVLVDGSSYAIYEKEIEKTLAAWDFIRWMLRVENQVKMVEISGSLPLSTDAVQELISFRQAHPIWGESLQYLPLAENAASDLNWMIQKDILSDISRRLVQFTTKKEDIPFLLQSADELMEEIKN